MGTVVEVKLPSRDAMVERLGLAPREWAGKCHAASVALVRAMAEIGQPAVVRRGWFRGETVPGAYFHGRPCQHSWVELPDGRVCDPTRFAFVGGKAWPLWVGDDADYDVCGFRDAPPADRPPSSFDTTNFRGEEMDMVTLELFSVDYLADLLGIEESFFGVGGDGETPWILLTVQQVFYLANLPVKDEERAGVLSRFFAGEVYEALVNAGHGESIPIDARDWVLGDGGKLYGRA